MLLVGVLSACQTAGVPLEQPIVHLTDVRLGDMQLFEQRYTIALRVENPNPVELPINGLSYRVVLNSVELGRGASRQALIIPPYGESIIQVDLVSNMLTLVPHLQEIARGVSTARFAIAGNISVSNRSTPLPFNLEAQFGGSS